MERAKELLKRRYLDPIKDNPEIYIGIELEYPIVHLDGQATDIQLAKQLMVELTHRFAFKVEKMDDEGNPIQLRHANDDCILFEVSYNTIEFAFAKAKKIQEVEERLKQYVEYIQTFLRQQRHELQGKGVNPNWQINDNRPVSSPRYQMLMGFLTLAKDYPTMHLYPIYGAFICGNQVQFDVSKANVFRVLNAFNKIEAVKAYLFANSASPTVLPDATISRDHFWEASMHGFFKENIGLYSEEFHSEEDYLAYMGRSAIFHAEREGEFYYFCPWQAQDYLKQSQILAYDSKGLQRILQPLEKDFDTHRSYHYQELTSRGTVEFRSVCAQPWEKTFAPTAFQLGLLENLASFEQILLTTDFYQIYGTDYQALRQRFSRNNVEPTELEAIRQLSKELLDCSIQGLCQRGYQEEKYLQGLLT
ncbi:gamma-glutamylcysteine synthetase [Streptococcus oriscaviae]|uniref:glutamate--cysteine ligase n=1 Tax=Streptococcus oriscaviae TaxID=2781599 RepID=A0ABX7YIH4_9STRE|nr:gamma-glutamylcysteine synthetase [Streptococcus oriscaviae]QUE53490.1 gamma-glutamylcysteine synthetase [Streptococcus oriscaviae]